MPADPRSLKLSELYHSRVATLAERSAANLSSLFAPTPDDDLQSVFASFIPVAGGVVTSAQGAAATLSGAYFRTLAGFETKEALEAAPPAPDNAGFTSDGRPITEVMSSTAPRVFKGLAAGWKFDQAVRVARASFQRAAKTEVMDAAGIELHHQLESSEAVRGWQWASRGTCGACLALDDGSVHSRSERMQRHPNCTCAPLPVFDVEQPVKRETGRERFETMSFDEQNRLLGTEKAELLRIGLIAWDDLISEDHHRLWSDSLVEASLAQVLASAG